MVTAIRLDPAQRSAFFEASKLLRERGLGEIAKLAAQRLQPSGGPSVVVVGEVKRGKSSLINSLLGHPGLSPVGVEVTTGAYLRFLPPTEDFTEGQARLVFAGGRQPVPVGQLGDWVTVDGSRNEDPDAPMLRGAEVATAGLHLPGVTHVDTPGVGGIDSGHVRLAQHAATGASLLIFVCDAGAPLTAPELKFLSESAESTESVVIAVTKIDKYPAGWREIIAANRNLLRAHAPRFADAEMVPVANPLADEAIRTSDPDLREKLGRASGIPRLAELIRLRLRDSEQVQVANAMRTLVSGLDQVAAGLQARREAATGSPEVRANLEAEKQRLEELRNQQSRWTLDLDRDVGGIRSQAVTASTLYFTEMRERWTAKIASDKGAMLPSGRRKLMAEITAELDYAADMLAAGVYDHLRFVVHQLFNDISSADSVLGQTSDFLLRVQPRQRALRPSGVSLMDPSLATTALFGAGIAKGMLGVGAASFFAPVVLAVGGAWLAVNMTHRVIKGGRSQLQTWMTESVAAVQSDLISAADTVLREFRPEIIVAFRDFITQVAAELKATLREAEQAEAASDKDRQARAGSFDRHLAAVTALRTAVLDAQVSLRPPGADTGARKVSESTGTNAVTTASK